MATLQIKSNPKFSHNYSQGSQIWCLIFRVPKISLSWLPYLQKGWWKVQYILKFMFFLSPKLQIYLSCLTVFNFIQRFFSQIQTFCQRFSAGPCRPRCQKVRMWLENAVVTTFIPVSPPCTMCGKHNGGWLNESFEIQVWSWRSRRDLESHAFMKQATFFSLMLEHSLLKVGIDVKIEFVIYVILAKINIS